MFDGNRSKRDCSNLDRALDMFRSDAVVSGE